MAVAMAEASSTERALVRVSKGEGALRTDAQRDVEAQAEAVQSGDYGGSQRGTVLPDAGGEAQHVEMPQLGEVGAHVVLEPVHDHLEGQGRVFVSLTHELLEGAEVVGPGQPEQTRSLVEERIDLLDGQALLAVQERVQPGVDVA